MNKRIIASALAIMTAFTVTAAPGTSAVAYASEMVEEDDYAEFEDYYEEPESYEAEADYDSQAEYSEEEASETAAMTYVSEMAEEDDNAEFEECYEEPENYEADADYDSTVEYSEEAEAAEEEEAAPEAAEEAAEEEAAEEEEAAPEAAEEAEASEAVEEAAPAAAEAEVSEEEETAAPAAVEAAASGKTAVKEELKAVVDKDLVGEDPEDDDLDLTQAAPAAASEEKKSAVKAPEDHSNALTNAKSKEAPEAENSESSDLAFTRKLAYNYLNSAMSAAVDAFPLISVITDPVKILVDSTLGGDQTAEKLDAIEKQLEKNDKNMQSFVSNSITLGAYGDKLTKLDAIAKDVQIKINNIKRNTKLSEKEKSAKIAELYNSRSDLSTALLEATKIFEGDTLNRLEPTSIYQVAYNSVVRDCMFSGEAVDRTASYLYKAMSQYAKAYLVWESILDAKEAVDGKDSVLASREDLLKHFAGTFDKNNKSNNDGILQKYTEYFSQDRFSFINKGNGASKQISNKIIFTDARDGNQLRILTQKYRDYIINIGQIGSLTMNQMQDIMNHAAGLNLDPDKNNALFKYLNMIGFNYEKPDGTAVERPTRFTGTEGVMFLNR